MKERTLGRIGFAFLSVILLFLAATCRQVIHGNDPASIERCIMETAGERLGDHVELLAVEDAGADRFVVFRLETKRPDERFLVRFQQNEIGNYEGFRMWAPLRMYCGHPGTRVYAEFPREQDGRTVYFVGWSENPELDTFWIQFNEEPEQTLRITENPALIILKFQNVPGSYQASWEFRDAQGKEL